MIQGYCRQCPQYNVCAKPCPKIEAELLRGPEGNWSPTRVLTQRKWEKEHIIYEHQMSREMKSAYNNLVYGAYTGDPETDPCP